jgi:hypothetical protein
LARSEISSEKIEAYRNTDYRFGEGAQVVTLRIDLNSDELAHLCASCGAACAVFITACDPFGEAQSRKLNEAGQGRPSTELRVLSARVIGGAGIDPSGAWPEESSFLALGIGLDVARDLGFRYRQDAIVWAGDDAMPRLMRLR